ncbi:RNA-dependent RNA polymerase [Egaro virus]|uniref:RNA-dependent RNA polymerase n=1 Tax=Egaro virus TaxID=1888318 RepID=UPI00083EB488|nr:RNA-dependent RNA polymerase [Egaro virus]AOC55064.1 RNA-dependent RNA polymerase [Egaro virus]
MMNMRLNPSSEPLDVQQLDFLTELSPFPVFNLQNAQKMQIHPPKVNMTGGFVSVARSFGKEAARDRRLLGGALAYFTQNEVAEILQKTVFCYGTAKGFLTRLKELTTRDCKTPYSISQTVSILNKRMPVLAEELPSWEDFLSLLENTDLTYSASAGPPYWRSKLMSLEDMELEVLPLVLEHMKAGTLNQLYHLHPELFLVEIKNKLDRYETAKFDVKCRPYGNVPFHMGFLASMIVQPFCKKLKLWHNSDSWNAYGFSFAEGSYLELYERLKKFKRGDEPLVGVYGDDVEIYFYANKKLYAVDPDFKQMDGSVDLVTVKAVCGYINYAFERKWGENQLWREVLKLLSKLATSPPMIIHGSKVFRKKSSGGIISGVVGTTLFDTAKSIVAYHHLLEHVQHDYTLLLDAGFCKQFLKQHHALEVKQDSWNPVEVNMNPVHLEPFVENKFLGVMRYWYELDDSTFIIVPYLHEHDWLTNILAPRTVDSISGPTRKPSDMTSERISFDRARGLLVTGGIFNKKIKDALYCAIDKIPSLPIVMHVQAGGGRGEKPGETNVVGNNFSFTDSHMIPSVGFVEDIYTPIHRRKGHPPVYLYPTLVEQLNLSRNKNRLVEAFKCFKVVDNTTTRHVKGQYVKPVERNLESKVPEHVNFSKLNLPFAFGKTSGAKPLQQLSDYAYHHTVEFGPMPKSFVSQFVPIPQNLAPKAPILQAYAKLNLVPDGWNETNIRKSKLSSLYNKDITYKHAVEKIDRLIKARDTPPAVDVTPQLLIEGVVDIHVENVKRAFVVYPLYEDTGLHWLSSIFQQNSLKKRWSTEVTESKKVQLSAESLQGAVIPLARVTGKDLAASLKLKIAQELFNRLRAEPDITWTPVGKKGKRIGESVANTSDNVNVAEGPIKDWSNMIETINPSDMVVEDFKKLEYYSNLLKTKLKQFEEINKKDENKNKTEFDQTRRNFGGVNESSNQSKNRLSGARKKTSKKKEQREVSTGGNANASTEFRFNWI